MEKNLMHESNCYEYQKNLCIFNLNQGSAVHTPFGDFSNKLKYAGLSCSDNYLKTCWLNYYQNEIVFSTKDVEGTTVSLNKEDYIK